MIPLKRSLDWKQDLNRVSGNKNMIFLDFIFLNAYYLFSFFMRLSATYCTYEAPTFFLKQMYQNEFIVFSDAFSKVSPSHDNENAYASETSFVG